MPLDAFISYAHKDRRLRDELAAHLSTLRTQGVIRDWWDGDLLPGSEWEPRILERLNPREIQAHRVLRRWKRGARKQR